MIQRAPRGPATAADLAASDRERLEVIDGLLEEKAAPSFEHADAQAALSWLLGGFFRRGGGGPGGWWIGTEVEIELEPDNVFLPDVAGWRRDRVPERPKGRPVRTRPDWVCEILSPSTAGRDAVKKLRAYHRASVPHYWILDPERETLTVYRHQPDAYAVALVAERGDVVRAEPFDAIEIRVAVLFGDDVEP